MGRLLRADGLEGTVDAGVATWEAFLAPREASPSRLGPGVGWLADEGALGFLHPGYHAGAPYHYFDASHLASYALRTARPSYRRRRADAFDALAQRFGSTDSGEVAEPPADVRLRGPRRRLAPAAAVLRTRDVEQLVELGP